MAKQMIDNLEIADREHSKGNVRGRKRQWKRNPWPIHPDDSDAKKIILTKSNFTLVTGQLLF